MKQLQSVVNWISVDDELPEMSACYPSWFDDCKDCEDVLVSFADGSTEYGRLYTDNDGHTEWGQSENDYEFWNPFPSEVIYWAKFPTVKF